VVAFQVASIEAGEGVEQQEPAVREMLVQQRGRPSLPDADLGDVAWDTGPVDLPAAQLENGTADHIRRDVPRPVDQEGTVVDGPGHPADEVIVEAIGRGQQAVLGEAAKSTLEGHEPDEERVGRRSACLPARPRSAGSGLCPSRRDAPGRARLATQRSRCP